MFAAYPEYIAYPNIDPVPLQFMNQFIREMQSLYGVPQMDQTLFQEQINQVRAEKNEIYVRVKRFRGRDRVTNPKFRIRREATTGSFNLDPNKEIQTMLPTSFQLNFNALEKFRTDPTQQLVISFEGDTWTDPLDLNEPLEELEIPFSRTHPEGYEGWFYFGRGVQLLISVEYRNRTEPNKTAEEVNEFHLHTIHKMLERRLLILQMTKPNWTDVRHRMTAFKAKVTHQRPFVDIPHTIWMFWSTPPVIGSTVPPHGSHRPLNVKFIDFQRGWNSSEDFVDKVCFCTEWCNWNAFFYHNPIYRFLLVIHNQLYMKERGNTTLPNMYLNVSVMASCRVYRKLPIIGLISHANHYRNKYYENYFLKLNVFKNEYLASVPNGPKMDAISYLRLKNDLDVLKLCHQLDDNPFADVCIEGLLNYFKVLTDLLKVIAVETRQYIQRNRDERQKWFQQIDWIGRHNYTVYIKESYVKLMRDDYQRIVIYDWLFTTDNEYSSRLAKTDDEIEIRSIRANILKRTSTDNPFNIRLILNNFLNTFVSIYKFLSSVEPRLSAANRSKTLTEMCDCYIKLDADFETYSQSNKTFRYQIESMDPQFQAFGKNFNAFYTLKLYFYLFEIQKQCFKTMLKRNKTQENYSQQVCENFSFFLRHSMVEQNYLSAYPGQPLFEISTNFEQFFDEFYAYWGRPDHETHQYPDILQNVDSGHFQFKRLYFWWKNNGNGKKKFKKIVDHFLERIINSFNNSHSVFVNQIMPSLVVLSNSYSHYPEIFDQLVYYAVKANCSVILSTTSNLMKKMHSLQIQNLVTNKVSYSLCKPGWVPLFLTMHSVLNTIDRLNRIYIAFDDEFERISNTCLQTKEMVKNIYRQFYNKLAKEWIDELGHTHDNASILTHGNSLELLVMHFAVGQAFIGVFIDDFRCNFNTYRKSCLRLVNWFSLWGKQYFRDLFLDYFRDRNGMRNAMPFQSNPWRGHLASVLTPLDQLTEQEILNQYHIDFTAADI